MNEMVAVLSDEVTDTFVGTGGGAGIHNGVFPFSTKIRFVTVYPERNAAVMVAMYFESACSPANCIIFGLTLTCSPLTSLVTALDNGAASVVTSSREPFVAMYEYAPMVYCSEDQGVQ